LRKVRPLTIPLRDPSKFDRWYTQRGPILYDTNPSKNGHDERKKSTKRKPVGFHPSTHAKSVPSFWGVSENLGCNRCNLVQKKAGQYIQYWTGDENRLPSPKPTRGVDQPNLGFVFSPTTKTRAKDGTTIESFCKLKKSTRCEPTHTQCGSPNHAAS
jgi:hypothetical protein